MTFICTYISTYGYMSIYTHAKLWKTFSARRNWDNQIGIIVRVRLTFQVDDTPQPNPIGGNGGMPFRIRELYIVDMHVDNLCERLPADWFARNPMDAYVAAVDVFLLYFSEFQYAYLGGTVCCYASVRGYLLSSVAVEAFIGEKTHFFVSSLIINNLYERYNI